MKKNKRIITKYEFSLYNPFNLIVFLIILSDKFIKKINFLRGV